MRKIAHIINPFNANPSSDLSTAQPITFESMRRAKEKAKDLVEVELWSAQYLEDRNMIPEGFHATRDLDRSVLDLGTFEKPLKLPLIGETRNNQIQGTFFHAHDKFHRAAQSS